MFTWLLTKTTRDKYKGVTELSKKKKKGKCFFALVEFAELLNVIRQIKLVWDIAINLMVERNTIFYPLATQSDRRHKSGK